MPSLNKIQIMGHLGDEPKINYTASGAAVANISVATSERWKDKEGEWQEKTEWHRVVAFQRLAEIMGEYLHKGSLVYIEGKIQTRKWQDDNGLDRYTTEIVAREMKMLDKKPEGGNAKPSQGGFRQKPAQQPASQQPAQSSFDDDDIPF